MLPARRLPANDATLTERAYRALEEEIVTLKLAPGAVVSEAMLSDRLGIGRTPVREALQRLARERLVQILPRRGIVVSEVNVATQLRLLEARRETERLIVRLAARRADARQRARFAAIADAMQRAGETREETAFLRLDREFNLLCLAAARNEFAEGAMALMHGLSRRFWFIHYREFGELPVSARLHADVAQAIADGDQAGAAVASDRLVDHLEGFTRATVQAAV